MTACGLVLPGISRRLAQVQIPKRKLGDFGSGSKLEKFDRRGPSRLRRAESRLSRDSILLDGMAG